MAFLNDLIDNIGTALNLPELGLSEGAKGGSSVNTGRIPATVNGLINSSSSKGVMAANNAYASLHPTLQPENPYFDPADFAFNQPGYTPTNTTNNTTNKIASAPDLSYLDDQAQQLRDLLARTDTGLNQGLTNNQDEYDRQLGSANASKDQQYANYQDQRVAQNQGKLDTYGTINKNANTGYNSLAQLIGRSAGTGSSAFRELLPNVIGKETSSQRSKANSTFGQNLQGIDKAQGQYDISFADVLDDLLRQKKTNENTLRSGIEGQRQDLNSKLGTVAGQRAQALGGGYAQVKAAQQPFQDSINNSRNAVESFFDQFRTAYTPKQAVAATPELAGYTTDRSTVNAQQQGLADPTNPYAALLKRKQQGAI